MQEVLLVIHLIIAIALVATVLLQRSEGGALGIGGGPGGMMSARGAANLLTRTTAILAACFFATSIGLTILAQQQSGSRSLMDVPAALPAQEDTAPQDEPALPEVPIPE
ncbi:MAG: preprotein translocase subunit SecG [Alphaproteobacteria bacterium]|nr:MAG: preprotein translocase subunit SecG [Alphaproteobacteria bacterium]